MRLQLAMDVPEVDTVMEVADLVQGIVDIFEVGTPVIMKYGNTTNAVEAIHLWKKTGLIEKIGKEYRKVSVK